jgi:hypothetical protein
MEAIAIAMGFTYKVSIRVIVWFEPSTVQNNSGFIAFSTGDKRFNPGLAFGADYWADVGIFVETSRDNKSSRLLNQVRYEG